MGFRLKSGMAAIAGAGVILLGALGQTERAIAQAFGQQEVPQDRFVAIASPYGSGSFQLLLLEQISNDRKCWSESGANPVLIDPLLLKFDFTGICGRSTDSNGYSIRMAGKDFGLFYSLSVVRQGNDLVLVGSNSSDRTAPVIQIGKTNGLPAAGQFAKFILNPGWRLTKRTLNNTATGHVYLTTDTLPAGVQAPYVFADVQRHWAKAQIEALAAQGIVSGFFEDGTFRPEDPVTRVQFAAIINKAFADMPPRRAAMTFKDVATNFWGYQAVQSASQKGFMSGYPEGDFKPNQNIPRLEVMLALTSGLSLPAGNPSVLSYYEDGAQIPAWATGAIAAATEKKMVINYPRVKQFTPARNATRAEVAAMVYQALVSTGKATQIPTPYLVIAP